MTVRETHPNMMFTKHEIVLSESDKKRLDEILIELQEIFSAESVGLFEAPMLTIGERQDYTIKIYNGLKIGYVY